MLPFKNRTHAGQLLAQSLLKYKKNPNTLILALPRGGLPIGYEISNILSLPLDAFIVRKLGCPENPELALGAVAMGGIRALNNDIVRSHRLTPEDIDTLASIELDEVQRRNKIYRQGNPPPQVKGINVILVDDGIATGATLHAAVSALKTMQPSKLIIAVPVAPTHAQEDFKKHVDEFICLETPEPFFAVGEFYSEFPQISDSEAIQYLKSK